MPAPVVTARIAVVGCGWWATRAHLPALTAHPDATIAAIVDPDDDNRARAAERFDVAPSRSFRDMSEMLDQVDLDGVIVAVPHEAHAAVAAPLIERGLPVLLEKPMTLRSEDARHLHDLAQAYGVELIIGYPWHYNTHVVRLRRLLADDRIGRIESVVCQYAAMARELYRGNPERYGDALGFPVNVPGTRTYSDPEIAGGGQGVTQTTHALALLLWLTGLVPRDVAAMTAGFELDVDLVDGLVIGFEGGAIGTLGSTGALLPGQEERLELRVYGTEGHVVLDLTAGRAAIVAVDGSVDTLGPLIPEERSPEWAPANDLVDVILRRGPGGSPSSIGVLTVELVEAMYLSSAESRVVRLGRES